MCSIFASYKKDTLSELADLNQYRGNFSYSITEISTNVENQIKDFGEFNKGKICDNNLFKLCHVQAPTGGLIKDINRIHPVIYNDAMLWHNGIITNNGVKYLQNILKVKDTFDTKLLLNAIITFGWSILSNIEGMFACVMFKDGNLFIFRTKHSKLYIDINKEDIIISSERYKNTKCIKYDIIYHLDISGNLTDTDTFTTNKYNVIIKGEI